jgi:hypothetical protein
MMPGFFRGNPQNTAKILSFAQWKERTYSTSGMK